MGGNYCSTFLGCMIPYQCMLLCLSAKICVKGTQPLSIFIKPHFQSHSPEHVDHREQNLPAGKEQETKCFKF